MMVRDEADIVAAMIEHHLSQGVDVFIITDNGSIDGTTEILRDYEARGVIELRHDPVHRKQQSVVVTAMARDAYTVHGADWVINADADEFFVPVDRARTLKSVLSNTPKAIQSFLVPVVNLTGAPAASGSGLNRLIYRDRRPDDLLQLSGILAHPTPDAIHIGVADVDVIQGNHFVSLASKGAPAPEDAIEVLHLPWRSWSQFRSKVEVSGLAYESNPRLTPSPNHHGMRDYRRLRNGVLLPYYLLRHPTPDELRAGIESGHFTREDVLARTLVDPVHDTALGADDLQGTEVFADALQAELHLAQGIVNAKQEIIDRMTVVEDQLESQVQGRESELAESHRRLSNRLYNALKRVLRRR